MKLRYHIEALLLAWLFSAFRAMPLDLASWCGSMMARAIGPLMSAHQTAKKNLAMAFPDRSERERYKILVGMWDNLGRTAAELAHLPGDRLTSRVHVHGLEHLPKPGQAALFFSGHLGNWELNGPMAVDRGIPTTVIYRHANNPYVDALICKLRASHATDMLPKGHRGAVKMVRALKSGGSIAMLIDQKMNDGIAVPFFGRDAMTATAIAEFSLRYDMPIIPARVVRTKGAHFEGYLQPPLTVEKTGDTAKDTLAIMTHINAILESWIREHPEQWFWVHQRWPK